MIPPNMAEYFRCHRVDREKLHMLTALFWSTRSLCSQPNRQVGAIITSSDLRHVYSFGYNGPARHLPHDFCSQWKVANDANPDNLSRCPCLHAECNAISALRGIPTSLGDSDLAMFVTLQPCLMCAQQMVNAGIRRVYYSNPYPDKRGLEVLSSSGAIVTYLHIPQELELLSTLKQPG